MWWSSCTKGGSTVARMLVRMISLPCDLIKHYCYVVDCPLWAPVITLMTLLVGKQYVFVGF